MLAQAKSVTSNESHSRLSSSKIHYTGQGAFGLEQMGDFTVIIDQLLKYT